MIEIFHTLRQSVRSLARSRALTLIAVLALTLGIGLTTAMYSIVRGALRDLPFENADRLMHLERNNPSEGIDSMEVTLHDFLDWRAQQTSFPALAAFTTGTANLATEDGRPERYEGGFMTANAFDVLQAKPRLGRTFQAGEDAADAAPVVVLGYDVWQGRFAGDEGVLGQTVRINGEATTIVGVMPEGFRFPFLQDLWTPLELDTAGSERGEGDTLEVYGVLADGITEAQAQSELGAIAARLAAQYPDTNEGVGGVVKPYAREFVGDEPIALLYTMLIAVFGVLIIACANVTNLLLARAALRSREVAVRSALGAGRLRVLFGVLSEALVLALVGAVLGMGLAAIGVELFDRAVQATDPPYWLSFRIDLGVAAFVVGITLLATLLSGLLPALQASGARIGEILKDEGRGSSSFRLGRLARGLVVAEIALSCGLLVATGLMVKSVLEVRAGDNGFPIDGIFTAHIGLFETDYPTPEDRRRFFAALQDGLEGQPGVRSVGVGTSLPLLGAGQVRFAIDGVAYPDEDDLPSARRVVATPGYLESFRVSALSGRLLAAVDREGGRQVALVNAPFAERYFPGESPLERRIRMGNDEDDEPWRTIVGVVPDLGLGGQDNETPEAVYVPLAQNDASFATLVAYTDGDPMALAPAVRTAVASLDPYLPIYFVRTMETAVREEYWFVQVFGTIFAIFGLSGLLLAVIGLYGVMTFAVQRRTHELGIRMALGADGGSVVRMLLKQGAVQLGLGTVLGIGLALALSRGIRILLYRVEPWDPVIFAAIVMVLLTTGLLAAALPARRASGVDPAVALRGE